MKDIFQHSLIVSGTLLLFSIYIITFTPFPILEYYQQNQREDSFSLSTEVEEGLVVKKDIVYDQSTFHTHYLRAVYQKGRSQLLPIVYYHPLGSSETNWLETEGMELARQGYLVAELREGTSNDYSSEKTGERLAKVQEAMQTLATENHSTLASFTWVSEGIGSLVVSNYLLASKQKNDVAHFVNPYFSFEDMKNNSVTTGDYLAAVKYEQAYGARGLGRFETADKKNMKKICFYTTEDFPGRNDLEVHLKKIAFDKEIFKLEQVPIASDVILQNH